MCILEYSAHLFIYDIFARYWPYHKQNNDIHFRVNVEAEKNLIHHFLALTVNMKCQVIFRDDYNFLMRPISRKCQFNSKYILFIFIEIRKFKCQIDNVTDNNISQVYRSNQFFFETYVRFQRTICMPRATIRTISLIMILPYDIYANTVCIITTNKKKHIGLNTQKKHLNV